MVLKSMPGERHYSSVVLKVIQDRGVPVSGSEIDAGEIQVVINITGYYNYMCLTIIVMLFTSQIEMVRLIMKIISD